MKERMTYLDLARITAIVLVVAGHFRPDFEPGWWGVLVRGIYSFHMPLLFFISGYLYSSKKPESYKALFISKFRRLVIPYLSASVVLILIKIPARHFFPIANPVGPESFLKLFYMPAAATHLWFLWALWWMFIVVGLFRSKSSRAFLFLATLVVSLLPFETTDLFCISEVKRCFVYFMAGSCAADGWFDWESFLIRIKTVVPLIWLVCLVAYSLSGADNAVSYLFMGLLGSVAMLSLCKTASGHMSPSAVRLTTETALASFTVYLFHSAFIALAMAVLDRMPFVLYAGLTVAAGFFGPLLIHEFLLKRFSLTGTLFAVKRQ
ncbi:MAG: acyltransferase family protein [Bacteroidales bacterium]|nr:acyltransferase family protein [Bacteroidales bacterium]